MTKFKFIGFKHPDELANGRPLAYGDVVKLDDEGRKANQRLIDEGLLLEMASRDDEPKSKTRREGSNK